MQSNAGSTRRVKYIVAAFIGLVFSLLAILVSFWASFYSSPRMLSEKAFETRVVGDASVTLPLPGATGEKLYYDLQVESTSNVSVSLLVGMMNGLRVIYVGEGSRIRREGVVYVEGVPDKLSLVFRCSECTVRGVVSIRYFSIDYGLLLVMNIVAVVSSLVGFALLAVGSYGYMIERRVKR